MPHNEDQEEAGQDQRQTNLQTWQTASWQRAWSANTVSQVAGYHRSGSAALLGSERDTPLHINADRSLRRVGVLGSVTHHRGKHVLKAGVEAARLSLHEDFSFFVTDEDEGEEADLSEGALEHDEDDPFVFGGRANPTLFAFYVQDSIQFGRGLTVDFGVRADRARMLVESLAMESAARRRVSPAGQRHDRSRRRSTGSFSRRRRKICCSDRRRRRASCRRSSTKPAAAKTSSPSGSGRPSLA